MDSNNDSQSNDESAHQPHSADTNEDVRNTIEEVNDPSKCDLESVDSAAASDSSKDQTGSKQKNDSANADEDSADKTVAEVNGNKTVPEIDSSSKTNPEISDQTFEFNDESDFHDTTEFGNAPDDESDGECEADLVNASDANPNDDEHATVDGNLTVEGLSDNTFEFDSGSTIEFGDDEVIDRNDAVNRDAGNLGDDYLDDDEHGTVDFESDNSESESDKTTPIDSKTTPYIADQTSEFSDDDDEFSVTKDDETVELESKSVTDGAACDNTFEFDDESGQTFAFDDGATIDSDSSNDEKTVDINDRDRQTKSLDDADRTADLGKTVPHLEKRKRPSSDVGTNASINRQSDSKSISDAKIKSLWKDHLGSDISPSMSIESMRLPKVAEDFNLNPRLVRRNQKALHTRRKLDYIVGRQLGAGGMGRVQMAHQVAVDRKVAFKEIQPKLIEQYEKNGERAQLESKFLAEAHLTASLDHPNIVSIYDLGIDQDNNVFYCMEIVDGKEWEDLFKENRLTKTSRSF